ncbi:MAG: YdeI/OmpD-associated family protein [Actinomycetota bacterium]
MQPKGEDIVEFATQRAWERWLEGHQASASSVWIRVAKKGSGIRSVTRDEAVESALCFGWIDGQARSLDERTFLQRFSPRRARSPWSLINRDRATELIRIGRMRPAGLEEVERAKRDGRWDAAYAGQRTATVPEDLAKELDARPAARAFFEALDARNRYAIVHGIDGAKKPETRARRIDRFVAMLEAGEKVYP